MVVWGLIIVYGVGNIGLMGILVDVVLDKGGKVVGVIFYFLKEKEVCYEYLMELYFVDIMDECKKKMVEVFDVVIIFFGGFGILDELFEMVILV